MLWCKFILLLSFLAIVSAGPPTTATVGSYTDPSCNFPTPSKSGLTNPTLFASLCTYYANGPPQSANSVSITFQSCSTTEAKLNTWSSTTSASCVGLPTAVVTYVVGTCTQYVDSGATYYYKVTCAPASAMAVSVAAVLASAFLLFVF